MGPGQEMCQVAYGTSPPGRLAYPYRERTVGCPSSCSLSTFTGTGSFNPSLVPALVSVSWEAVEIREFVSKALQHRS